MNISQILKNVTVLLYRKMSTSIPTTIDDLDQCANTSGDTTGARLS